jgi:predicted nucleotide-binding protein
MTDRKPEDSTAGAPQVPPAKGIELLQSQINKAHDLSSSGSVSEDDYRSWYLLTRSYVEKAFGADSPAVSRIMSAGRPRFPLKTLDSGEYLAQLLQSWVSQLKAAIELLQTEAQLQQGEPAAVPTPELGHRVFLVHGHDEGVLHEVARFLEKLKHDPIVLKEEPGKGRTIIEKFEDYASEVGFVVVLLTPDDRGGPADKPYEDQQLRARQNVVLELGYFIGKLCRNRVCALRAPDVEIPSDYSGVQYVSLDGAGWRWKLAKEMKAAGLDVDMNLAV